MSIAVSTVCTPELGWRESFALARDAGYAGEIREFADAVLDKREPYPGTDDVAKAMRVIDAILKQPDGTTRF